MLHTDIPHEFPGDDVHPGVAGWNIRREYSRRCIFDNTALGGRTADVPAVKGYLWDSQRVER